MLCNCWIRKRYVSKNNLSLSFGETVEKLKVLLSSKNNWFPFPVQICHFWWNWLFFNQIWHFRQAQLTPHLRLIPMILLVHLQMLLKSRLRCILRPLLPTRWQVVSNKSFTFSFIFVESHCCCFFIITYKTFYWCHFCFFFIIFCF